jgi:diaminopimelate epimerase
MSGSGNDFIVIDNRQNIVDLQQNRLADFISKVCRRKLSVGADGLILIEASQKADFKWRFYNSDGSTAEMCGNGARCAARFAYENGISGAELSFETQAGTVRATVSTGGVKVKMPDPFGLKLNLALELDDGPVTINRINTGVPHVVMQTDRIDDLNVVRLGRQIRFHPSFAPQGTNANFMSAGGENRIAVRTYERGVEDETLACGTGAIASALVAASLQPLNSPVTVKTRSGELLRIYFKKVADGFTDIFMEGDARIIYTAELDDEAWS